MRRRTSFPASLYLTLLLCVGACATATNDDLNDDPAGDGDGDGDGDVTASGGAVVGSSGGSLIGPSSGGGSNTGGTGGSATGAGGGSSGGASSGAGGAGASTGGTTYMGACADEPSVSAVSTTGEFGVFTCTEDRDSCKGVTLNEPALFECVSSHGPNCSSQNPQQGQGVWSFTGLCSEFGMGGAIN